MTIFRVEDMSCDHCTRAITEAVRRVDPAATVQVDLGQRQVRIDAVPAGAAQLGAAIVAAGYGPVPMDAPPARAATTRSGGCGCGCGAAKEPPSAPAGGRQA